MKILLFGSGFIATSFVEQLLGDSNNNHEIVGVYNLHKIPVEGIIQYKNSEPLNKILDHESPDYIICFQGNSFVPDNVSLNDSIQNNVLQIGNFLDILHKAESFKQIKKILIIGSAGEYGKLYDAPIEESTHLHPTSLYGLSKIFLYNCAMYYYDRGLPIVYARQFNTVGPKQREEFVFQSFVKQIVMIEKGLQSPIIKVGDLTQERDFIDVRDTISAYMQILENGVAGESYNVGSGEYVSIGDLLDRMMKLSNLDKNQIKIEKNPVLFNDKSVLSRRLCANIEKLKSIGFQRNYSLNDSIKTLIDHWRKITTERNSDNQSI